MIFWKRTALSCRLSTSQMLRRSFRYAAIVASCNISIQLLSPVGDHRFRCDFTTPARKSRHKSIYTSWAALPEARLLFELALGTGQRSGDLLTMRWLDFDGTGISLRQNKTGTTLWVPCTDTLLSTLNSAPRFGETIITAPKGNSLTRSGAEQRMRRISEKAGTRAYTLHGLRYCAASLLAEMGATDAQIAAITGHKAREMVQKYSSGANQKRLAMQVVELRERNKNKS